jgi:hypothetical protein
MKTRAEHEPSPIQPTDARAAAQAADRLVALDAAALVAAPPDPEGGSKRPTA